jgi:hypothetical protein
MLMSIGISLGKKLRNPWYNNYNSFAILIFKFMAALQRFQYDKKFSAGSKCVSHLGSDVLRDSSAVRFGCN